MTRHQTTKKGTPLSSCRLWQYQQEFFSDNGIHAWVDQVPFYITSNPYIADAYATIAVRFMQDYQKLREYRPEEPFVMVELGAGSGRFSFYVLKRIHELLNHLTLTQIRFVYVMTDFTGTTMDFWQSHPALADWIDRGILDFAVYNAENDQEMVLVNSGRVLSKGCLGNPMIVMANYLFDTICHDAFQIAGGRLQEGLVTLTTPKNNLYDNRLQRLEDVHAAYTYHDIDLSYYDNDVFNSVLEKYQRDYDTLNFLFPKGALTCIEHLSAMSDGKLVLLASDNGFCEPVELKRHQRPELVFHGSFSMMVNFHAIAEYIRLRGGVAYTPPIKHDIKNTAFFLGCDMNRLTETSLALANYIQNLSPGDVYNVYEQIKLSEPVRGLETVLSYLNLTSWDPHVFNHLFDFILYQAGSVDPVLVEALAQGSKKIEANFYHLPNHPDTMMELGRLFHAMGDYKTAIYYYDKAGYYNDDQAYLDEYRQQCHDSLNPVELI